MGKGQGAKVLLIGYGNTLRCDDGIGQLVAMTVETWNEPLVESLYLHQLTPELAEKIAEFDIVIFVDASIDSKKVKLTLIKSSQINTNFTHYLTPESLISLSNFLYQKTPEAWLISIPIKNLNLGEEISDFALEGKQKALEKIKQILNQMQ